MNLNDDDLLRATAAARDAAHDAPKADNGSRAWADRANEWMRLADEVDRRGLVQPLPHDKRASEQGGATG